MRATKQAAFPHVGTNILLLPTFFGSAAALPVSCRPVPWLPSAWTPRNGASTCRACRAPLPTSRWVVGVGGRAGGRVVEGSAVLLSTKTQNSEAVSAGGQQALPAAQLTSCTSSLPPSACLPAGVHRAAEAPRPHHGTGLAPRWVGDDCAARETASQHACMRSSN